jgi:hypothetical protein
LVACDAMRFDAARNPPATDGNRKQRCGSEHIDEEALHVGQHAPSFAVLAVSGG